MQEGCPTLLCSGTSAEVQSANMAASSTSFAEPLMSAAMYMPFNSSLFDARDIGHCVENEMVSYSTWLTCMLTQSVQADLRTFKLNI